MDGLLLLVDATRNQRTIVRPALVEGYGYWSGRDVRVEFQPAETNTGLVFVRTDLPGRPRIPARIEYRAEMPLRTALRSGGADVEMIEHILAALGGLGIDNCEIRVDESEMPGCDGSAMPFVTVLENAGIVTQQARCRQCVVDHRFRLGEKRSWIEVRPSSEGDTWLAYELDYGPHTYVGRQTLHVRFTPEVFRREIAPSRTFILKADANRLLAQGLGQRASFGDLLVFDQDGPIDNTLRFPDECVRHKLLDLVGDLTLAGCEMIGSFRACRSGHRLNAEMTRILTGQMHGALDWRRCA